MRITTYAPFSPVQPVINKFWQRARTLRMNLSAIQVGDHFRVLRFTAIAQHISDASIYFELAHVSQSRFSRTSFGHAAIMTGSQGEHDAIVLLAVPAEYQATEMLSAIQKRLFEIVDLPEGHSFVVYVSPRPVCELHGPYADGHFPPIGS